jgi:hypothetical protein
MRFVIASAFAAVVAVGLVAPALSQPPGQLSGTRAYMVEPYTPPAPITIQGAGVRLRAEPFATPDTRVLSSGSTGLPLNVVGIVRQPDWDWYQVILRNGQKAFIRSDLTSAPSRVGASASSASVAAPVSPQRPALVAPPVVAPPVLAPPVVAPPVVAPPLSLPLPGGQPPEPLPPIPTQPLGASGAISLTPSSPALQLPPPSAPESGEVGLLSVAPAAPTPRLEAISPAFATAPSSVGQQIRAQLEAKRCWSDSSSMMDAERLKASFVLTFNASGRFASEPRLLDPGSEPANDPAMMVFIAKARAALRTCNALGFSVPAGYTSGAEIRVDFTAR